MLVFVSLAVVRITAELMVLAVTLCKTFHQVRQASSLGMKLSLSETLLRDGAYILSITWNHAFAHYIFREHISHVKRAHFCELKIALTGRVA